MTLHVRDAGIWKSVTQAYVRDAGVWKPAQVYINDAGTWKLVSSTGVTLNTDPIATALVVGSHTIVTNTLNLLTDGTITSANNDYSGSTYWLTPTTTSVGNGYHMRYHENSKAANISYVGNITKDTWVPLSSARQIAYQNININVAGIAQGVVNISSDGGATTLASFNVSFEVGYVPL